MSFFRWHPRPKKIKKSAFGGIVKSQKEVDSLHESIESHEEREAMQADIELEQQIKQL
jgi:head-tail adaptor